MRYQVPQFIEIEDKIFGPLTLKQFLYVAGGSSIAFIIWSILPTFLAIIVAVPILIFFFALAFYKVNQRPLIATVESAVKYFFNQKLYIWHKTNKKPTKADNKQENKQENEEIKLDLPKMSDSKLKELTWSLDINQNLTTKDSSTGGAVENNDLNLKV